MQRRHSSAGDDGLTTPSNLPPRIHLGQIADFWQRYDKLANTHDRKMYQHLNDNLDVLLIFVSLSVVQVPCLAKKNSHYPGVL